MKAPQTSTHHRFKQFRILAVLLICGALIISSLNAARAGAVRVLTESTIVLNTAEALPLQGTFQVVSNEPGNQTNPHVECNLVTYTNDDFRDFRQFITMIY
jgi:hypothetical protein